MPSTTDSDSTEGKTEEEGVEGFGEALAVSPVLSVVPCRTSMASPYSRKSSGSSRGGSWKRRTADVEEIIGKGPASKKSKFEPPSANQRSITSYFNSTTSSKTVPLPNLRKAASAMPSVIFTSLEPKAPSAPASQEAFNSLSTVDTITIMDDDDNWETDSQKTEVLTQLEPLMSELLNSSQCEPADVNSLYYYDELDSILQTYDVDAVLQLQQLKQTSKEPSSQTFEGSQDPQIAYYLSNFISILNVVEEKDRHLFSAEELDVFRILRETTIPEQKLFSRLLYRKGPWFQVAKLDYNDIPNITRAVDGLLKQGVFEEPQSVLDILPALNNQQLRQLTKSASGLRRDQLLSVATKWVSNQRTLDGKPIRPPKDVGQCIRIKEYVDILFKRVHRLFFLNQVEDQTTLILIHTGQIKYPTYLIPENHPLSRSSNIIESDEIEPTQALNTSQLSYELSVSVERDYPTPPMSPSSTQDLRSFLFATKSNPQASSLLGIYSGINDELENVHVLRKVGFYSVFKTRADLDEYENALQQSRALVEIIGSEIDVDNDTTDNDKRKKQNPNAKNLNDEASVAAAMVLVEDAVYKYKILQSKLDVSALELQDEELGAQLFLNRFTALWVYSSIIWVGISLLERQKKYREAVVYLKMLLDQYEVNRGRRGDWWIRLVFDVAHLKETSHAIELCSQAILDDNCRPQHLLKLYDKLRILIKAQEREQTKLAKEEAKRAKEEAKQEALASSSLKTPKKASAKRGGRAKSSASSPIKTNPDDASSNSTSPVSPSYPSPDSTPSRETSPTRARVTTRSQRAVPIPLPGETPHAQPNLYEPAPTSSAMVTLKRESSSMEIDTEVLLTPTKRESTSSAVSPPTSSSTPKTPLSNKKTSYMTKLKSCEPAISDNTLDVDKRIPGLHRSPPKTYSPSVRHASPVQYNFEASSLGRDVSPIRLRSHEKGSFFGQNTEEDELNDEDEDGELSNVGATEITPELADRFKTLGVPCPEKLDIGTVETIIGVMGERTASWGKSVFVDAEGNPCHVEDYSLEYYQTKATPTWPKGAHCEGSPYYALFALLFWDIIFDATVPYVFQTPYQDAPLDITTEVFYISRKAAIDSRLKMIFHSPQTVDSPVARKIADTYFKWHGRACRGIDWARWKINDLQDIARCLGGPVLSMLCERFAIDYRFTHSGLPDLLLWNPDTNKAKLVEVKGPGDRLSEKQKIWIDALSSRGCDIVTLYVKKDAAISSTSTTSNSAVASSPLGAPTPTASSSSPCKSSSSPTKAKIIVVEDEE